MSHKSKPGEYTNYTTFNNFLWVTILNGDKHISWPFTNSTGLILLSKAHAAYIGSFIAIALTYLVPFTEPKFFK